MKMTSALIIPLLSSVVALTACNPREDALPPETINGLQTAFNNNDPKGAAALFTEDGAIFAEFKPPLRGKTAIEAFQRDWIERKLQLWTSSEGSLATGNIGYDQGTYHVRDTNTGEDIEVGKYVNIFRRVNGTWKIYRTAQNSDSISHISSVQITPVEDNNPSTKSK